MVALKELLGSGDRARFATEALVTGNLEHPGMPSVYERGVDERGLPFYAMRKVRGRTLAALLASAQLLFWAIALRRITLHQASLQSTTTIKTLSR